MHCTLQCRIKHKTYTHFSNSTSTARRVCAQSAEDLNNHSAPGLGKSPQDRNSPRLYTCFEHHVDVVRPPEGQHLQDEHSTVTHNTQSSWPCFRPVRNRRLALPFWKARHRTALHNYDLINRKQPQSQLDLNRPCKLAIADASLSTGSGWLFLCTLLHSRNDSHAQSNQTGNKVQLVAYDVGSLQC